jgi:hypothetical protein
LNCRALYKHKKFAIVTIALDHKSRLLVRFISTFALDFVHNSGFKNPNPTVLYKVILLEAENSTADEAVNLRLVKKLKRLAWCSDFALAAEFLCKLCIFELFLGDELFPRALKITRLNDRCGSRIILLGHVLGNKRNPFSIFFNHICYRCSILGLIF